MFYSLFCCILCRVPPMWRLGMFCGICVESSCQFSCVLSEKVVNLLSPHAVVLLLLFLSFWAQMHLDVLPHRKQGTPFNVSSSSPCFKTWLNDIGVECAPSHQQQIVSKAKAVAWMYWTNLDLCCTVWFSCSQYLFPFSNVPNLSTLYHLEWN